MFASTSALLKRINIALVIHNIAIVILELSILDIQIMLHFMVKTHLEEVKSILPPQPQIITTTLHILILICIATTIILVSATVAPTATTVIMSATAEADQLIQGETNNLSMINQVQL